MAHEIFGVITKLCSTFKRHITALRRRVSVFLSKNIIRWHWCVDLTAKSPGEVLHVDTLLTLNGELSWLYLHVSHDQCQSFFWCVFFLSPHGCRIKSEILSRRYETLFLMDVHHWWHTQENTFPRTPHHCQAPAVPVPVVFGAEGERCPRRCRDSL